MEDIIIKMLQFEDDSRHFFYSLPSDAIFRRGLCAKFGHRSHSSQDVPHGEDQGDPEVLLLGGFDPPQQVTDLLGGGRGQVWRGRGATQVRGGEWFHA